MSASLCAAAASAAAFISARTAAIFCFGGGAASASFWFRTAAVSARALASAASYCSRCRASIFRAMSWAMGCSHMGQRSPPAWVVLLESLAVRRLEQAHAITSLSKQQAGARRTSVLLSESRSDKAIWNVCALLCSIYVRNTRNFVNHSADGPQDFNQHVAYEPCCIAQGTPHISLSSIPRALPALPRSAPALENFDGQQADQAEDPRQPRSRTTAAGPSATRKDERWTSMFCGAPQVVAGRPFCQPRIWEIGASSPRGRVTPRPAPIIPLLPRAAC